MNSQSIESIVNNENIFELSDDFLEKKINRFIESRKMFLIFYISILSLSKLSNSYESIRRYTPPKDPINSKFCKCSKSELKGKMMARTNANDIDFENTAIIYAKNGL